MKKPLISCIVALGTTTNIIGNNNKLIWNIPDDLIRFKKITLHHPVIMGRKTWESIPQKYRPLPERTNIVLTHQDNFEAPGALIVSSLEEALEMAQKNNPDEIFIIGGEQLYKQTLPHTDKLYLTLIDSNKIGDTFFPDYTEFNKETFRESHIYNGLNYTWINRERSTV